MSELEIPRVSLIERLVKGSIPIVIVVLALYGIDLVKNVSLRDVCLVLTFCILVLWFGWPAMKGTAVTKWLGAILLVFVAIPPAVLVLGLSLYFGLVLLLLLLIALPFLIYDLFFRAPLQGRIERIRTRRLSRPLSGNTNIT